MTKKVAFIIQQTPYRSDFANDAIDAVLAAGLYGQTVSVFFVGDGVFQLIDTAANASPIKPISKKLKALSVYDVEAVYACQGALTKRGIQAAELAIEVDIIKPTSVDQFIREHDSILSF